jgi:hypothetical protein
LFQKATDKGYPVLVPTGEMDYKQPDLLTELAGTVKERQEEREELMFEQHLDTYANASIAAEERVRSQKATAKDRFICEMHSILKHWEDDPLDFE